jgi:hypothetical protein
VREVCRAGVVPVLLCAHGEGICRAELRGLLSELRVREVLSRGSVGNERGKVSEVERGGESKVNGRIAPGRQTFIAREGWANASAVPALESRKPQFSMRKKAVKDVWMRNSEGKGEPKDVPKDAKTYSSTATQSAPRSQYAASSCCQRGQSSWAHGLAQWPREMPCCSRGSKGRGTFSGREKTKHAEPRRKSGETVSCTRKYTINMLYIGLFCFSACTRTLLLRRNGWSMGIERQLKV